MKNDLQTAHSQCSSRPAFAGDKNTRRHGDADTFPYAPNNLAIKGEPYRLMLPLTVSSSSQAEWLTPLLEPMGIRPMAGPVGALAGLPPKEIDPRKVKLEPGSVLSIPLAWGDADLNAAGTVTDVLPDGTVLAFGHAMFGQGHIALPMATGFVHFVVPRQSTSFKLGGTAVIRGSIVRDENSAIAGIRQTTFKTTRVTITVIKGDQRKQYNYTAVQHDRLTPSIVAQLATQSLEADTKLPAENTLHMTGAAVFAGNRKVKLNALMSPGVSARVMAELLPAIGSMVQNPHEPMMLESLDLELHVTPNIQAMRLLSARIEKTEVEPGDKVKITIHLQRHGKSPTTKIVYLRVPDSLTEGRYPVTIADGRSYLQLTMSNRPHLMKTATADEVHQMVRMITAVRTDALYLVLQLPRTGLAVGRHELPLLPSSRAVLIRSAANTVANTYADTVEQIVPMNAAVTGSVRFELRVRKPATHKAQTTPPAGANKPG